MKKILYAEDDKDVRELYVFLLESEIECEVTQVESGNQAIEKLKSAENFDFVITDFEMDDGSGEDLYRYFTDELENKIPFFLISGHTPDEGETLKNLLQDNPHNRFFQKPINGKEVVNEIKSILNFKKIPFAVPEYCRIRIVTFVLLPEIAADVYIKINDVRYLKIIHKNEAYDRAMLAKYYQKNIKYLYIERDELENFTASLMNMYAQKLAGPIESKKEKTHIQISSVEGIQNLLVKDLSMSEHTVNLVTNLNKSVIDDIQAQSQLGELLQNMMNSNGYLYQHSLLVSFVACGLCIEMSWNTESTMEKLSTAAFMHDIDIEDDEVARIHDLKEIDDPEIPPETVEYIKKHPTRASELVVQLPNLPPDVDSIILCQHEKPDSTRFPRKIGGVKMAQIGALFNLAHQYVNFLFKNKMSPEGGREFYDSIQEAYNKGNYKKPLEALLKFIEKQ